MGHFHVDEFGRMGAIGSTSGQSAVVFPAAPPPRAPTPTPEPMRLLPPKSAAPPVRYLALGRVKPRAVVAPSREVATAKTSGAAKVLLDLKAENDAKWARPSPFGDGGGVASSGSSSPSSGISVPVVPTSTQPAYDPAYVPPVYTGPAERPQVSASPTSSTSGAGSPYVGGSPLDSYSPSYGGPSSSPLSVPDGAPSPGGASASDALVRAPAVAGGAPPAADATGYYIAGGVLALAAGLGLYMALR